MLLALQVVVELPAVAHGDAADEALFAAARDARLVRPPRRLRRPAFDRTASVVVDGHWHGRFGGLRAHRLVDDRAERRHAQ